MPRRTILFAVLACALLLAAMPLLTRQVVATGVSNAVADPGFENTTPGAWFVASEYHNGTVNVHSTSNPHIGSHSAMLSALNRTLQCSASECKDSVTARVEEYVQSYSSATLNNLASAGDSLSAWWYVADPASTGVPTYSLHIGILFTDGSSIEYWYGMSDLSDRRYYLGPIPATGTWFEMSRNLLSDIQGKVANPTSTRVSALWFGAFGGTNQSIVHGEVAWLDDVSLNFNGSPVAVFSSSPAGGTAPLTVRFDATQSYETSGSSSSIVSYQWSFGDGSSSSALSSPIISHTYSGSGTFQVTLTVMDGQGFTSASSSTVRVDPSDITVPLIVAGAGGAVLLGGLFFGRFRRRSAKTEKTRRRFRKG